MTGLFEIVLTKAIVKMVMSKFIKNVQSTPNKITIINELLLHVNL